MTETEAIRKLAELGFEIDWSVTERAEWGGIVGVIDPIGKMSISGDCIGSTVEGETAGEFYASAVELARALSPLLRPCTDPHCDMHAD